MFWLCWTTSQLLNALMLPHSSTLNLAFILAVLSAWNTLQNDSRLSDHITQIGFAVFYGNLDQKEYLINYAVICASDRISSYSQVKKNLFHFFFEMGR